MRILIVVDMQNDFVDGVLGTPEAKAIVPNVFGKIEEYRYYGNVGEPEEGEDIEWLVFASNNDVDIMFTQDTHFDNYLETEEGKHLPIPHCIKNTKGWEIIPEFDYFKKYGNILNTFEKHTFGSDELFNSLQCMGAKNNIESIELVGVCTDICVISNAIIAKSALPDVPIYVDASCCAGTTPENHKKAIELMENSLYINILNKEK